MSLAPLVYMYMNFAFKGYAPLEHPPSYKHYTRINNCKAFSSRNSPTGLRNGTWVQLPNGCLIHDLPEYQGSENFFPSISYSEHFSVVFHVNVKDANAVSKLHLIFNQCEIECSAVADLSCMWSANSIELCKLVKKNRFNRGSPDLFDSPPGPVPLRSVNATQVYCYAIQYMFFQGVQCITPIMSNSINCL